MLTSTKLSIIWPLLAPTSHRWCQRFAPSPVHHVFSAASEHPDPLRRCKILALVSPGGQILIVGEQDHALPQLGGLVLPVGRTLKDVVVPNVAIPVCHQWGQEG